MIRTDVIRSIQTYLGAAYVGPITILAQEDDGDLTPPCAIVRVNSVQDMGANQAELWMMEVVVAVFHDADDTAIETAESQAEALFLELADCDAVTAQLVTDGKLVSVWRPTGIEAGREETKWVHHEIFELIVSTAPTP